MGPIDYSGAMPQVNFTQDIAQGLQAGQMFQQRQLAIQQKEAEAAAAQQYKADLDALNQNPSEQAFSSFTMKYPKQHEAAKQAWAVQSEGAKKSQGEAALQTLFAMNTGKADAAKAVVQNRITALKNAGQDATHEELILGAIDTHPEEVKRELLQWATFTQDPTKLAENLGKIGAESRAAQLHPSELAAADTKAAEAKVDLTTKAIGVIAQKAGALSGVKGTKPAQVESMFKALAAQGVIPKDELPDYLASIPQDPAAIPEYLNTYKLAGMKADDQMKFTTPTADASLSATTQVKTTGMNNATSRANNRDDNATTLKVQDRIDARESAKGSSEPTLPPEALSMMAQQYLAGDKTVMQNLGRGAQGSANIVALRAAITKEASAKGMTGPQIAAAMADYAGQTAGMRTSGTISARIENAAAEAGQLIPIALAASEKVSRAGLLPFGKVQVMFNNQTNDPLMAEFATANLGLATAYAGAMARGGKATVSDMEHAREVLSTAKDHTAYKATINMMKQEIEAARRAPNEVRTHLRNEISGAGGGGHAPSSAPKVVNFGDLK